MTKTHEEIVAINAAWSDRITDIKKRYKPNEKATDAFQRQMLIAIATYVLQTGLTPETAEAFIEEQLDEFQVKAARECRDPTQFFRDRTRMIMQAKRSSPHA